MNIRVEATRDDIALVGQCEGRKIRVSSKRWIIGGGDIPVVLRTGEDTLSLSSLPRAFAEAAYPDDFEHRDNGEILRGCPGPYLEAAWDEAMEALEQWERRA